MSLSKIAIACGICFFLQGSLLRSSAQNAKPSDFTEIFGGKIATLAGASYSPTSQHILIGHAQDRKITQAEVGFEYSLKRWSHIEIAYEGAIVPLFFESDPTYSGTSTPNATGPPTINLYPYPVRYIGPSAALGHIITGGSAVAITPVDGPRQTTYAFAALPVGGRVTAFPHSRIQPTFAANLGCLYAARNIPVDNTASFNFLAYVGPGIEVFWDRKHSLRIEYLYEHLSNGNLGSQNPGIDSGTFRLTLTRYH